MSESLRISPHVPGDTLALLRALVIFDYINTSGTSNTSFKPK
jgi:hypothetical protein